MKQNNGNVLSQMSYLNGKRDDSSDSKTSSE